MKNFCRCLIVCLILISAALTTRAQVAHEETDPLESQINLYGVKKASPVLFVHLDKTIYTNNETVWFTGYLLNIDANAIKEHRILSVSLVNDEDGKVAVQANFIMDGGLGFGNIYIPDSVAAGSYHFVAYTNRLLKGRPEVLFKQSVTIKTTNEPAFSLSLSLLDSTKAQAGKITTLLTAKAKEFPVIMAPISYKMGAAKKRITLATAKTGVNGEYTLSIDKNQISPENRVLIAEVGEGKQKESIRLTIPIKKQKARVRFYPEGGYLVSGKASRVGWEARGAGGEPLKINGILLNNGTPIDTITTDSYGMGIFKLTPKANSKYQVKVIRAGVVDTVCTLPASLQQGIVLQVADALQTDSITLKLQSTRYQVVKILVHNYKEVFVTLDKEIYPKGLTTSFATANLPRGLNMVTVVDSIGRPLAERAIFAHYDKRQALSIKTDNNDYTTRQKVKLNLKLSSASGSPVKGYVSVACVQDNRLSYKHSNNIESYYYLTSQLNDMPLKDNLMGSSTTDKEYINNVLLIKGWSRYTWQEMLKAQPADTLRQYQTIAYSGDVTFAGKRLKKPMMLSAIADTLANIVRTDSTGHFVMDEQSMVTQADKKMVLFINGKAKTDPYVIHFNNPFEGLAKNMADTMSLRNIEVPAVTETNEALVVKGLDKTRQLQEVKIKGVKDGLLYASIPKSTLDHDPGVNECGDYKCMNDILNCPNHPNDNNQQRPLKKGDYVKVWRHGQYVSEIYRGCVIFTPKEYTSMVQVKGIYASKEFYVVDYDAGKNNIPEYQSTIYWQYNVPVNSAGETNLWFFTNDVTGPFRIIAQGVTQEDVLYGEQTFNVKKKLP
jgi:hypothetical protein